jgi:hypothetical protein
MTADEDEFYKWLCHNLGWEALRPCKEDADIFINLTYIENGEDDSAFMLGDDDHQFEIYLDKRMPFGMCIDFLIHELAHVHSWAKDEKDDHGPEWGKSYARLYRLYLKLYDKWFNK